MATKDLDFGNVIKQAYDPANQALQVNIVASTGGGGSATAGKQDEQTALLTTIEANQDTANAELLNISNKLSNYLNSPTNSSTTALGANGIFTGTAINISGYASIFVAAATDVPSAVGGLSIQFSPNGTNWDHVSHSYDVPAGGLSYSIPTELVFMRVVYTNGSTAQAYFRLTTVLNAEYVPPSLYTIAQPITDYALATPTKTVIYGKTTGGGGAYVAVKVTPSGALTNETSITSSVLPTGAATEAKQDAGNTSLTSIDSKLTPLSVLGSFVVDFSSIPNSTTTPFEISPSLASATKKIILYDTTGEVLQIRTGAGTGSLLFYVGPGQDGTVEISIPVSTRISVRSNGNAPTAGSFIITFLG